MSGLNNKTWIKERKIKYNIKYTNLTEHCCAQQAMKILNSKIIVNIKWYILYMHFSCIQAYFKGFKTTVLYIIIIIVLYPCIVVYCTNILQTLNLLLEVRIKQ